MLVSLAEILDAWSARSIQLFVFTHDPNWKATQIFGSARQKHSRNKTPRARKADATVMPDKGAVNAG
ncbi:hypothetical protein CU102_08760 [Phyllobacterium brassicacearum]|uniref:Uncharacterized protein n=1 Tax=Phyllobacterium brassicacearum TaxID=314235 RepID=A0A2P7BSK4_9HYPH|nr:hypothetical protein CU102_08760 [Phyllobacterium brassicacearum]